MPLMSTLSRHVFHPLWDIKDRSHRLRILRELERSQWLPQDVLRARQQERLVALLRYAGKNSPYYESLFRTQHFDPARFTLEAFQALPLLTKATIRACTDEILSREFSRSELGVHRTGGSTGVALTTYFDQGWRETRTADAMRSDQWAGLYHGMKVASLWGNPPIPRSLRGRVRALLRD